MQDLESHLSRIKARWLIGGAAAGQVPPEWQPIVGADGDAELRLVVLVGQASQIGFRPVPSAELTPSPGLPSLSLPCLPAPARARFRRVLGSLKPSKEQMSALLALLAGRGYVAHPADWMPDANDEGTPAVYGPWIAWQTSQEAKSPQEELTEENWDLWWPAERRAALRALRVKDPSAAAALIVAKGAELKADQRLRVVELFAVGLSEIDVPYLEGLAADRSGKVKELAARLLARLGRIEDADESVVELAEFLKVGSSGLLDRGKTVSAKKLKTNAQRNRRRQLFDTLTLSGLAAALEMSELDLVRVWRPTRDTEATIEFVSMVAQTGSDAVQRPCLDHLLGDFTGSLLILLPLVARLDETARRDVAAEFITRDELTFEASVACAGERLGLATAREIEAAPAHRAFLDNLKKVLADDQGKRRQEEALLTEGLVNLGLLADQSAAAKLLEQVTAAGMMSVDPQLDLLHLNAALERRSDHD
ncbi:MAG: DUF5691 domain-containing protein [Kiloniellales bacterium]|nr:DUF5691 domain-containing protein [Kiloniellales bacterium]